MSLTAIKVKDLRINAMTQLWGGLSMCILSGLSGCASDNQIPKPPLVVPFNLDQPSTLENFFHIVEHDQYSFKLQFSFRENDKLDRARVKELVGGNSVDQSGNPLEPGVPTPVTIEIQGLESANKCLYTKTIDPILTSWGGDSFDKVIVNIALKPGSYKIKLKHLRNSPEFQNTKIALMIISNTAKVNFIPDKYRGAVCQQ